MRNLLVSAPIKIRIGWTPNNSVFNIGWLTFLPIFLLDLTPKYLWKILLFTELYSWNIKSLWKCSWGSWSRVCQAVQDHLFFCTDWLNSQDSRRYSRTFGSAKTVSTVCINAYYSEFGIFQSLLIWFRDTFQLSGDLEILFKWCDWQEKIEWNTEHLFKTIKFYTVPISISLYWNKSRSMQKIV